MVVCADCSGMEPALALRTLLPLLERLRGECQRTSSPDEVRASLERAQAELGASAQEPPAPPVGGDGTLKLIAARPEMGGGALGLLRVLYQVERELTPYRRGAGRTRSVIMQPHHLRVPACAPTPLERAELWLSFLDGQLEPAAPVTVLTPLGQDWVDLVVGTPTPAQFLCLRASSRAVPLTTDIPYTLDDEFVARARRVIDQVTT
jgi:hypothetical protein